MTAYRYPHNTGFAAGKRIQEPKGRSMSSIPPPKLRNKRATIGAAGKWDMGDNFTYVVDSIKIY